MEVGAVGEGGEGVTDTDRPVSSIKFLGAGDTAINNRLLISIWV